MQTNRLLFSLLLAGACLTSGCCAAQRQATANYNTQMKDIVAAMKQKLPALRCAAGVEACAGHLSTLSAQVDTLGSGLE